ncbi:hypothetical protein A0J57_02250 [Sphingobium sp. 22B]|nr:hypothetical protein AXW74_13765 [Sphingobium sp. AM]KYC34239.1 hypothetical protein A0J57_02250 [Sphingobium sp. 22B]OAP33849.1 hypothetical protein A8O16_01465 [Sphingobium sp. 20006FA]TKV42611.1 hypothetical protein A0U87_17135 [Sphingobium sp. MP9-4]
MLWLKRLAAMIALILAGLAVPAHAQPRPHIAASIVAASDTPRPGATTRIAIRMAPEAGWHGYWINPGDSGLSVEAKWQAPAGATIGALRHPAPTLLELAGIASYVHEGPFTLLADLKLAPSIAPGTALPIAVDLNWLACSDTLCVPERATLRLQLVSGDGAPASGAPAIISAAEAALPRSGASGASGTFARIGPDLVFDIAGAGSLDPAKARLFPASADWFEAATPQSVTRAAGGAVTVRVAATGERPSGNFSGVLSDGRRSVALTAKAGSVAALASPGVTELPDTPKLVLSGDPETLQAPPADPGRVTSAGATPALFAALMGALIGGLLLNLMPCVFPILSLKALSLARAGGNRSAARIEGIAYFAGSVATTALLGAILIAARALGHDIGWSFQLQDPRIILLLMLLSLGIALNLAGLFEIRGISLSGGRLAQPGWSGAFGTGALAAVIATPCSGPFLGVALGAALVLPAPATLAVFAGLGAGMALPFLLIAFVPALRRVLPKPGRWMETFRRLLAIPMLLTAIGLAWVLGRQSGVDGLVIGLLLAAMAAVALWWAGLRQSGGKGTGIALSVVAGAALLALVIELPAPASPPPVTAASASAEPFSEARLAELRAQGKPVFVDMTADWCLICQVNKRVAIDRASTQEAFARAGVTTLVGDWTRGDPAITRFLAARGRNSVPYYLFVTRGGELRELPQVLTSDMLVEQAATS